MNRLFSTLRNLVERPHDEEVIDDALPGFDNRVEVLYKYAESAVEYENDLEANLQLIQSNLDDLQSMMEFAIDQGQDRDALEYLRLAARIRPQRDLLDHEIRTFHVVAADMILRVSTLMEHLDEARAFAQTDELSPAATQYLDRALNRLTRYFVLLERVARSRRQELPQRLAEQISLVIDDRQLDLELARYVLSRRHALGSGNSQQQ